MASFSMALIVLFSTFSFTVDEHYCGNVLVDFSLFGKAKSCGMELQQAMNSQEQHLDKKGCCEDQTLSIAGQHDLKISLEKLIFEQHKFVAAYVYIYLNHFEGLPENIVPFNHYPPPILIKDISILDQTFLI